MTSYKSIPELSDLEQLALQHPGILKLERLADVAAPNGSLPLYGFSLGSQDPTAPTFGLFGGVHGLERIGSQVLLSFLKTLLQRISWEKDWQFFFDRCRLVSIPIINPVGMSLTRRGNGNNVDLMRNAPIDAKGKLIPLISGHRRGPHLPWFRGYEGQEMELENQTVIEFCRKHFFKSQSVITLDLHSGFGLQDRVWYPWAYCRDFFPHENEMFRLKNLFDQTYPYHIYKIERQSENYSNHGDLWDWIYQLYMKENPQGCFLPLTLEMGSWMWVKKNLWQLFTWEGLFNPVKRHRYARTMRRHYHFIEFLLKAANYHQQWNEIKNLT
jgi:hypothetical protein